MNCHARGNQGNWFATVDAPRHPEVHERDLPCIWDVLSDGKVYTDRGFDLTQKKFKDVVDALLLYPYAIMRKRFRSADKELWRSAGYIAIFKVADIEVDENGLSFRFVERVCNLD